MRGEGGHEIPRHPVVATALRIFLFFERLSEFSPRLLLGLLRELHGLVRKRGHANSLGRPFARLDGPLSIFIFILYFTFIFYSILKEFGTAKSSKISKKLLIKREYKKEKEK